MYSSKGGSSFNPGNDAVTCVVKSRKLTAIVGQHGLDEDDGGKVSLEDYRPIDPAPSSKASIRPAPVQHGSPLLPYIPKTCPPPKHGG
ncbi:Glycosyl hydrolase family 35 protein [Striga hermonthica]|uniref:Glycosyl hydrolase family 35 protein n=1 Tax=Striga hermonthica TaxID=68872 RepID=A0A9N7RSW7_STRHE|nr:Glycosyl hydrolase family 35 protein [Striga hermonthica]